jgi:hypothetical protein
MNEVVSGRFGQEVEHGGGMATRRVARKLRRNPCSASAVLSFYIRSVRRLTVAGGVMGFPFELRKDVDEDENFGPGEKKFENWEAERSLGQ